MSGHGGHKHRKRRLLQKRARKRKLGRENVARVRARFEKRGQSWDPSRHATQAEALNHLGRRVAIPAQKK
jgi:hypothetical protein